MLLELTIVGGATYLVEKKRTGKKSLLDKLTCEVSAIPLAATQSFDADQFFSEKKTSRRQVSTPEITVNHYLKAASVTAGVAITSLKFTTLTPLVPIGILYCSIPAYKRAYKSIFIDHKFSSYICDAILMAGLVIGGYYLMGSVSILMILFGHKLRLMTENHSKNTLKNLFGQQPRTVWLLVDGVEVETPFEQLPRHAIVVVNAGQIIPVDGHITQGYASVDQHKLTGESQPIEKEVGGQVLASTLVLAGKIYVQAEKTGQETAAAKIGEILESTADFRSTLVARGEAIADKATLPTLTLMVFCLPTLGLSSAMAVLTNMVGYKMRGFGPLSMLTFLNIASQKGILIKDGRSLELLKDVDTFVFDKTGTLTMEQPHIGHIHACNGVCANEIIQYAAAAEHGQNHPIARAILAVAAERGLDLPPIEHARYEVGYGIQVDLADRKISVGSHRFMALEGILIPAVIIEAQQKCDTYGHSLIMVAFNGKIVGAIELHATIRPEAYKVIEQLHQRNIATYIISGDQEGPTRHLAQTLGIDNYFADTLPENKAALVEQLHREGRSVCFVGDGINDAIALKKAKVSVSMAGATTVATDTAQVVLLDGSLNQLVGTLDIAHDFEKNMKTNFLIATIPSLIFTGGILCLHWGITSGLLLTNAVMFTGFGNTVLPLIKEKNKEK
jgi:heavy metal translocating P-type ATPase